MSYFLLIALVPILCLSIYYYTSVSSTVKENLALQSDQSLERIIDNFATCLDDYRHRSYEISIDETVRSALKTKEQGETPELYKQLYQAMKGTIYDASAHLVSADGRRKYSTHEFPLNYDLRYHSNDDSIASVLTRLTEPTLLLTERYVNNRNDIVMMNMIRSIKDEDESLIGYVIIDLFSTTLSALCDEHLFSDIILIDRTTLNTSSLIHTDTYGDYSQFPALTVASTNSAIDSVRISADYIIAEKPIADTMLSLVGIIDISPYTIVLDRISLISLIIMVISILGALLVAYLTSNHITGPISKLVSAMKQVELRNLTVHVEQQNGTDEIQSLTDGFNDMVVEIRQLIDLTKEEERQLREAERKALQAQINPHFLYNTLYTIKALATLHGENQILQISTSLGRLLRNSISSSNDTLPLSESIDLVRSYLTIVQIRFPDKLDYSIAVDDSCEELVTPKFIIQPFVENAISHGLEPKLGVWRLRIEVYCWRGYTAISIIDNGIGFDPSQVKPDEDDRAHIGIQNVMKRIELYYQGRADVKITSKIGTGTVVRILLPKK